MLNKHKRIIEEMSFCLGKELIPSDANMKFTMAYVMRSDIYDIDTISKSGFRKRLLKKLMKTDVWKYSKLASECIDKAPNVTILKFKTKAGYNACVNMCGEKNEEGLVTAYLVGYVFCDTRTLSVGDQTKLSGETEAHGGVTYMSDKAVGIDCNHSSDYDNPIGLLADTTDRYWSRSWKTPEYVKEHLEILAQELSHLGASANDEDSLTPNKG